MPHSLSPQWPEGRLADHATVKARLGWKGLKAEEYLLDGPIFLASPNLRRGRIDFDHVDHITEWRYSESPEIQLRAGDVLLVKDGSTLGMCAMVRTLPAPSTVNGSIAVIRANPSLESGFLYCLITGDRFQKLIWTRRAGLGVPHLFQADLREFKIPLPPLSEQRHIAEISLTIDETIERTEALIAKHQQIKVGLMHDLFTRGLLPEGRLRSTFAEEPNLYRQSEIGWLPVGWSVVSLRECARPGRAHLKTGPFGSSLKTAHWVDEGRPVITIGALGEGKFVDSELLHVSEDTANALSDYQLSAGDVVFSRVADVGRSAVITPDQIGWIMSSNLMRICVKGDMLKPDFLQTQLAHDGRLRTQIRRTVNSSGRDVANGQVLNRLRFARPPLDEQDRIMEIARSVDSAISTKLDQVQKLQRQKVGLMQALLKGRIQSRVTESATV